MGRVTASEASQSPPHRHIRDESLYASTGFFFACGTADIPGVGINASPGLPDRIRQVARYAQRRREAPKNNKARARPGLAHSMTINNRLSASAGRGPSARSHRW